MKESGSELLKWHTIKRDIARFFSERAENNLFAAALWFSLSVGVHIVILQIAGYSSAAGYIHNSVRPFLLEASGHLHDIVAADIDIDRQYSIRYLEAMRKLNSVMFAKIDPNIDKYNEYRQAHNEKIAKIDFRIIELRDLHEEVDELGATFLDRYGGGDEFIFLVARLHDLVEKHFRPQDAAMFSVMRVEGLFNGGVVINNFPVSHWLWRLPLLISFVYIVIDLISRIGGRRKQLPTDAS